MKTLKRTVCFILIVLLIFIISYTTISDSWLDTTFKCVSKIETVIGENKDVFPLKEKTSIKYKTSDSSYVLISKGNIDEIKYFYESIKKYDVVEKDDQMFITKDDRIYIIKKLADDLKYVKYSISAQ